MTLTLALETATDWASVAVGDADGLVAQVVLGRRRHAAALMPAIEHVLGVARSTVAEVQQIVLADGPGSFTGLRIGAATVQGLVRARPSVRVSVVPSLMATAWVGSRFHPGEPVAAWYDALRGEIFAGLWRWTGRGVEALMAPTRAAPADVVAGPVSPALVLGDGAALHAGAAQTWSGRPPVGPPAGAPRAAALLALHAEGATRVVDPVAFVPDYGRPAEAQARWEAEHGRPLPHTPGDYR